MKKNTLSLFFSFLFVAQYSLAQTTYYVSLNGDDNHNGITWTTSFRNITKALSMANLSLDSNVTINIAEGIYKPTDGMADTLDRHAAFLFIRNSSIPVKNLMIYGSYDSITGIRNPVLHPTILDGNIGNPDSINDNSHHVIVIAREHLGMLSDTIIVNGFIIKNGYAYEPPFNDTGGINENRWHYYYDAAISSNCGAGLYIGATILAAVNPFNFINVSIKNCQFSNNMADGNNSTPYSQGGGAVYIIGSPLFDSCLFLQNKVFNNGHGGAILCQSSESKITNSIFMGNEVRQNEVIDPMSFEEPNTGGAIYVKSVQPFVIDKCAFYNNKADFGGAVDMSGKSAVTNCIFAGNDASFGGGAAVYSAYRQSNIYNNIFCRNTAKYGSVLKIWYGDSLSFSNNTCYGNYDNSDTGSCIYTFTDMGSFNISNSIFANNKNSIGVSNISLNFLTSAVKNCNVEAGFVGNGNIIANPLFVDTLHLLGIDSIFGTTDDGLRLQYSSSCINAGSNNLILSSSNFDITGGNRIQQSVVDMGAYEQIGSNNPMVIKTVNDQGNILSVFPNPAHNYFSISTISEDIKVNSIGLFDISGRGVYKWSVSAKSLMVKEMMNLVLPKNIPPGVYIVNVELNDGKIYYNKLIVE